MKYDIEREPSGHPYRELIEFVRERAVRFTLELGARKSGCQRARLLA